MPGFSIWDVYGTQEYLTPGAAETLDLIDRTFELEDGALVLDVAYGRGSGALRLAARGWRVLGVDTHPFAVQVARGAGARALGERAAFVTGDGGALPVRDGVCDAAICIGGPSIIGTQRCLRAMHRALRRGGWLAVSDWMWRSVPVPPDAIPAGYGIEPLTADGYAALVRGLGFEVAHASALPREAWDAYYAPIRPRVAELRAAHADTPPQPIEAELRAWDSGIGAAWWRYGVVIARRR
ncbi:MAG TPA: class I SAM-dependent methyltransferase [Dehalococcoidia bacterium]|nr:class I SAM-dependent methyltransferase [Dehalococcoidia bacterium]